MRMSGTVRSCMSLIACRVAARISTSVAGLAALGALLFAISPAQALNVNCIEASRYKNIFRIFNNDPTRFAAYFGINPRQLPNGETCRALLITGPVDPIPKDGSESDFDRLLGAIRAGRGWVATLYLASPGGNIATGLRLGEITRMFWLNASAVEGGQFDYVPDFIGAAGPGSPPATIPPDLEAGWRDYLAATQPVIHMATNDRQSRRCASACTYLHAAGIYRYGQSYFHRGRRNVRPGRSGAPQPPETSMSELLEGLQKTEDRVVAFYRKMDAGDDGIQAFQNTATETTMAATPPPMPRYIADYLKKQCLSAPQRQNAPRPQLPLAQRPFPDGFADLQCIAASNEHERLSQFAKLCPNDCDRNGLFHEATVRMRALLPDDSTGPQRQDAPGQRPGPELYRRNSYGSRP